MLVKVRAHCPLCDHDFEVHRRYLGRRVRCLRCWKPMRVSEDAPPGSREPARLAPPIADSPVRERLLNGPTWLKKDEVEATDDDRFARYHAERDSRFAALRERRAQVIEDRKSRREHRRGFAPAPDKPNAPPAASQAPTASARQDPASRAIVATIAAELVTPEKADVPTRRESQERGERAASRAARKGLVRCRFCRRSKPDHPGPCPHCGKAPGEHRPGAPARLPWARAVFALALLGPFTGGCLSFAAIPLSIKVLQSAKDHKGAVGAGYAVAALVISVLTLFLIGPIVSEVMKAW